MQRNVSIALNQTKSIEIYCQYVSFRVLFSSVGGCSLRLFIPVYFRVVTLSVFSLFPGELWPPCVFV